MNKPYPKAKATISPSIICLSLPDSLIPFLGQKILEVVKQD